MKYIIKSMAELNDTIKVSKQTKNDLLERKKKGNHSSIDSLLRTNNLENDLLKKEVKELKESHTSLKKDLKETIKEKNAIELENEMLRKKLESMKK